MNSFFCYLPENQYFNLSAVCFLLQYLWLRLTADFPHLDLKVSDFLEKHATPEARTAHIDLADWLLEYLMDKS